MKKFNNLVEIEIGFIKAIEKEIAKENFYPKPSQIFIMGSKLFNN
jgi:hypothetical protein